MEKHLCYAPSCGVAIDPTMFMCPEHWNLLPADARRKICRYYRKDLRQAGLEWTETAREVIEVLGQKLFERCLQSHKAGCGCWKTAAPAPALP
jgi:hypothetical protein